MRILLVTRVISPFQIELGEAFKRLGHDIRVLFSTGDAGTRPKHWLSELPRWCYSIDVESQPLKMRSILADIRPEAIVYGGYRGYPLLLTKELARRRGIPFGLWLEKPLPAPTWRLALRDVVLPPILAGVDFVWPIGPSALKAYSPMVGERTQLNVVPYGQELRANLEFERTYPGGNAPVRFLFSGKYQHRNNVWELLSAFRNVRLKYQGRAELVLSGYAGMDEAVRKRIQQDPVLSAACRHDTQFETWEDRLRPFKQSDVLCMPGTHAGWGLIVPEAMSLGMPVIAGPGIESAQMLVRDGVSGALVGPAFFEIERAMESYLANPDQVREHGINARGASQVCDATNVATRMAELLSFAGPR